MKHDDVVAAWDADTEGNLHPFDPDSPEFWDVGVYQAAHVAQYTPPGGTVLDHGCGNGRLTIPLGRLGFRVYAADASRAQLRHLVKRLKDSGESVRSIILSDGRTIVGAKGTYTGAREILPEMFDTIVARAVLIHHAPEDVMEVVAGLVQALRPGGHFIADWPTGIPVTRDGYLGVTVWGKEERAAFCATLGLEAVDEDDVSVWRKAGVSEGAALEAEPLIPVTIKAAVKTSATTAVKRPAAKSRKRTTKS